MERGVTRYAPARWRPGGRLAQPMVSNSPWMQDRYPTSARAPNLMGLSVLSGLAAAGLHGAINPSFTELRAKWKPEEQEAAITGLWIGLAAETALSGAVWVVFREWIPALVAEATALILFGVGYYAVTTVPVPAPGPPAPVPEPQTEVARQ